MKTIDEQIESIVNQQLSVQSMPAKSLGVPIAEEYKGMIKHAILLRLGEIERSLRKAKANIESNGRYVDALEDYIAWRG